MTTAIFTLIFSTLVFFLLPHSNCTNEFGKYTDVQGLLNWEAPDEFIINYPYFLAGYDNDDLPVWIISLGRWDMKAMSERDYGTIRQFDKYIHQMYFRLYESPKRTNTNQFIVIDDMEGYSNRQLVHRRTVRRQIELFQEFAQMEKSQPTQLKKGFGVNLNFPARTIWTMVRPTLGELGLKIEVYGTQKWRPVLLKELPQSVLPPWLGGSRNFTEIQIWGRRKFRITPEKNLPVD